MGQILQDSLNWYINHFTGRHMQILSNTYVENIVFKHFSTFHIHYVESFRLFSSSNIHSFILEHRFYIQLSIYINWLKKEKAKIDDY